MSDIRGKMKEMGLDKSNFECFIERNLLNIVSARIVDVEILPDDGSYYGEISESSLALNR